MTMGYDDDEEFELLQTIAEQRSRQIIDRSREISSM